MIKENTRRGRLLAVNTVALSIGRLASKLLVFLLVRFYTYILTPADYGTADLITGLSNFLIPLACAGLSSGFFRFAAEAKSRREQTDIFSAGVCILILASMGFALCSPLLLLIPYISNYVWLILLYVLCANIHYLTSDFIRAQGHYRLFAVQGLINTALNIAFNLLFLLPLSMGLTGYVLSIVAADALTALFLVLYCRLWRYLRPGAASLRLIRGMLRYCIPLIPASLCWWITNISDRYMVTAICGEAQNGLYAAAYKIPNLLTIACGIFIDAWQFSAVLENRKADDEETKEAFVARRRSLRDFFSKVLRGYMAFLSVAAGGLILFSPLIAKLLFDPSFSEAARYIPVLLLATVLSALCNFVGSVYMVERRGVATMLTSLAGAALNILLNFILIPPYGPMGAAVATVLSYLLVLLLRIPSTRRLIRYRLPKLRLLLNALLLIGLSLCITYTPHGYIVYSILLFLLLCFINAPILLRNVAHLLHHRRAKTDTTAPTSEK